MLIAQKLFLEEFVMSLETPKNSNDFDKSSSLRA